MPKSRENRRRSDSTKMEKKVKKNTRERKRIQELHNHFMALKRRLPYADERTKTKAQILARATEYIDYLEGRIKIKEPRQKEAQKMENLKRPSCRYSKVGYS